MNFIFFHNLNFILFHLFLLINLLLIQSINASHHYFLILIYYLLLLIKNFILIQNHLHLLLKINKNF